MAQQGEQRYQTRWRGGRSNILQEEMKQEIVDSILRLAGRPPVTAFVIMTERVDDADYVDGEPGIMTFVRGGRYYVAVLERHFTIIVNTRYVDNDILTHLIHLNQVFPVD